MNIRFPGWKTAAKRIPLYLFASQVAYLLLVYVASLTMQGGLIGNRCLPEHLKEDLHNDYLVGKWIPRKATSACFVEPPIMVLGNQKRKSGSKDGSYGPSPLPERGAWQLSAAQISDNVPLFFPYFALTTKSGWHFRIGCRWDDLDHYYTFPSIALKKIDTKL